VKSQFIIAERELKRLMHNALHTEAAYPLERLVRLADLGEVLLGDGLIGRATAGIVAKNIVNESVIEKRAVASVLAPSVLERIVAAIKEAHWLQRQLQRHQELSYASFRDSVTWRGQQQDVGQVLVRLRDERGEWSDLTLADLRKLNDAVWPSLSRCLHEWKNVVSPELSTHGELQQLLDRVIIIGAEMTNRLHSAETAAHLANATDYRSTLGALSSLVAAVRKLREAEPYVDLDAFNAAERDAPELLPRLERLVSSVGAHLLAGVDRAFAIDRLIVSLEHFEREALLEAMADASRPEQVLQRAVDRFLFSEGVFPVTNASIGRGRPDTLFELSPTQHAGMQVVMLELKQVVTNVTAPAVRKAVDQALDQLQQYSSSLQAHPEWSAHEIVCLVVYAGKIRYRWSSNVAVKLVYIGDAPPSARAIPLQ
jgi:hypothetical protein